MSRSRALQGFTYRETLSFVISLKQPLRDARRVAPHFQSVDDATAFGLLDRGLDELGLHTVKVFQKNREEVIVRQHQAISELSTPVIKLWTGILALPLIGTLDRRSVSSRSCRWRGRMPSLPSTICPAMA